MFVAVVLTYRHRLVSIQRQFLATQAYQVYWSVFYGEKKLTQMQAAYTNENPGRKGASCKIKAFKLETLNMLISFNGFLKCKACMLQLKVHAIV